MTPNKAGGHQNARRMSAGETIPGVNDVPGIGNLHVPDPTKAFFASGKILDRQTLHKLK